MVIDGKCHCGNISFSLTWDPDPKEIPARACDCSFCRKHGGVWTSNPRGALEVRIQDRSPVDEPHRRPAFTRWSALNAFDNVDPSLLNRAPASFGAEQTASRLARRKRNWIPDVSFR